MTAPGSLRPPGAVMTMLDTETTGLAPLRGDRVVSIGLVHLDAQGRELGHFYSMINPERDPGPVWIHGLTAAKLSSAPVFADLTPTLLGHLGPVLLAHNAPFDLRFLGAEFQRLQARAHPLMPAPDLPWSCTLALARNFGVPRRSLKLSSLCSWAGFGLVDAHNALADARAAARVLAHMIEVGIVDARLGPRIWGHTGSFWEPPPALF